jgi:hypothetical protein
MCAEGLVKCESVLGGLLKSAIRSRQLQSKLSDIGSGNMVGLLGIFMLTDT